MNTRKHIDNVVEALSSIGEINLGKNNYEGFVLEYPTLNTGPEQSLLMEFCLKGYLESHDVFDVADVVDLVLPKIMALPNLSLESPYGHNSKHYIWVSSHHYKHNEDAHPAQRVVNFEFCIKVSE